MDINKLISLRLLVCFLGEAPNFNWWATSFFSGSAKVFMEPVFTRTPILAQYYAALEAAKRLHDENLRLESFHIFRLPEEVEINVHYSLVSLKENELKDFLTQDKNMALHALNKLAEGTISNPEGPLHCGDVSTILDGSSFSKVASIYFNAFQNGIRAYPYFGRNT